MTSFQVCKLIHCKKCKEKTMHYWDYKIRCIECEKRYFKRPYGGKNEQKRI